MTDGTFRPAPVVRADRAAVVRQLAEVRQALRDAESRRGTSVLVALEARLGLELRKLDDELLALQSVEVTLSVEGHGLPDAHMLPAGVTARLVDQFRLAINAIRRQLIPAAPTSSSDLAVAALSPGSFRVAFVGLGARPLPGIGEASPLDVSLQRLISVIDAAAVRDNGPLGAALEGLNGRVIGNISRFVEAAGKSRSTVALTWYSPVAAPQRARLRPADIPWILDALAAHGSTERYEVTDGLLRLLGGATIRFELDTVEGGVISGDVDPDVAEEAKTALFGQVRATLRVTSDVNDAGIEVRQHRELVAVEALPAPPSELT